MSIRKPVVARDHVNGRGPSRAMGGMKRSGRFSNRYDL